MEVFTLAHMEELNSTFEKTMFWLIYGFLWILSFSTLSVISRLLVKVYDDTVMVVSSSTRQGRLTRQPSQQMNRPATGSLVNHSFDWLLYIYY